MPGILLILSRELVLNAISLAFGFAGNFCLLLNFTRRIRYIIALPLSIVFWYMATAIVCSRYSHNWGLADYIPAHYHSSMYAQI